MPDELIVVDDCSTDNSLVLLYCLQKKYPFMRIIPRKKNGGPFKAFMDGARAASCEFVSPWACDDEVRPGYIEQMRRAIRDYPFVDTFTCNALVEREGVIYKRTALPFNAYISPQYLSKVARTQGVSALNVIGNVIRREHILKCWEAGGNEFNSHFDAFYIYTAAFKTGMILLGDHLVFYRSSFRGFGSSRNMKDNLAAVRMMNRLLDGFPEAKKYMGRLNIWRDRHCIAVTLVLKVLPYLPMFVRRLIYRQVYGRTFCV
jgi:glycosyltransferase involved in cell wall biosynthesis